MVQIHLGPLNVSPGQSRNGLSSCLSPIASTFKNPNEIRTRHAETWQLMGWNPLPFGQTEHPIGRRKPDELGPRLGRGRLKKNGKQPAGDGNHKACRGHV